MALARNPVRFGLIWLVTLVALLWPAFVNGGPIWFPDSLAYLNSPRTAIEMFFGPLGDAANSGMQEPPPIAALPDEPASTPYAGRSIYYGGVIYLLMLAFGPWGSIVFQAAVLAAAVVATARLYAGSSWLGTALVSIGVATLTTAPFFTSYMMPDFMAGLAVLAVIRLLGVPDRPRGVERVLWWMLAAFAAIVHTSHLLILIGLMLVAPVVHRFFRVDWSWRNLVPVGLAGAAAVAASLTFSLIVTKIYGQPPLMPPFLSARLIDDGPGYTLLAETCPDSGYELCKYLDRLPQYSDDFLWARNPHTSVYAIAPTEEKRRLSKEQFEFAIAVIAQHPWAQIKASWRRFIEQLSWFGLHEFAYTDAFKGTLDRWFKGDQQSAIRNTKFFQGRFPMAFFESANRLIVLASMAYLAVSAFSGRRNWREKGEQDKRFAVFCTLVILGIIGNGAITGILSTPHDRYQARIIWLLPMLALLLLWRNVISVYLDKARMEKKF